MAVIHISRAEAAKDFDGLLTHTANGDEVFIESDKRVVARLLPTDAPVRACSPNRSRFSRSGARR